MLLLSCKPHWAYLVNPTEANPPPNEPVVLKMLPTEPEVKLKIMHNYVSWTKMFLLMDQSLFTRLSFFNLIRLTKTWSGWNKLL